MTHYAPEIAASNVVEIKAARPNVLNTNRSGRPFTEQAGAVPLNLRSQSQGCLPARYAASHGTAGDKDRAPFSNRALVEGFADLLSLQSRGLLQSVVFACAAALFVSFFALAGALSVIIQSKVIDQ